MYIRFNNGYLMYSSIEGVVWCGKSKKVQLQTLSGNIIGLDVIGSKQSDAEVFMRELMVHIDENKPMKINSNN